MKLSAVILAVLFPALQIYSGSMNGRHIATLVDRSAVLFLNDDLTQPGVANLSKADDSPRKSTIKISIPDSFLFHSVASWSTLDQLEDPIRVVTVGATTTRRL